MSVVQIGRLAEELFHILTNTGEFGDEPKR
jgi:hypothetical protein